MLQGISYGARRVGAAGHTRGNSARIFTSVSKTADRRWILESRVDQYPIRLERGSSHSENA